MALILPVTFSSRGGLGAWSPVMEISPLIYSGRVECGANCSSVVVHTLSRRVVSFSGGCDRRPVLSLTYVISGPSPEFTTSNVDRLKDYLLRDTPASPRTFTGINTAISRFVNSNRPPLIDS